MPDLKHGYSRVANLLLEAFSKINLSAYESRVVFMIIRNTYGWQRYDMQTNYKDLANLSGIERRNLKRTILKLYKRNILKFRPAGKGFFVGIQGDVALWDIEKIVDNFKTA